VRQFVHFAVSSGRADEAPPSQLQRGDIVIADWEGADHRVSDFFGNHLMIVTGFRNGIPLVAAHTANLANTPLLINPWNQPSVQSIAQAGKKAPSFIGLHIVA
jgi:hypothetical protein